MKSLFIERKRILILYDAIKGEKCLLENDRDGIKNIIERTENNGLRKKLV